MIEDKCLEGEFKDKVVIITGATSGIGRELALQLARQGAWLSLAARDENRLRMVAKECHACGVKVMIVATDISQEEQTKRLIEDTLREYGRIDVLINNAGVGIKGDFEEYPDLKLFKLLTEVNYYGSVYATYYALPHLKKTKGRIVAVASVLGKTATPGNTAYCGSKFALAGFFDSLRLELKEGGVSVTTIYPGLVSTEFAERMLKFDGTPYGSEARKFYPRWVMKPDTCARIIIRAAAERRRQVVMTFYGRVAVWLNFLMPNLADRIAGFFTRLYRRMAELE